MVRRAWGARGLVVVICALVAGAWAVEAPVAVAANYFDGMKSNNGNTAYRGARGNIDRYNPRVGPAPQWGSSAWVMLDNSSVSGAYAQVGWCEVEEWGNNPYYFWEYASQSGYDPGPYALTAVPNGGHFTGADDLFTVQFSTSAINYRINGVNRASTGFNWTPDNAQFYGEIVTTGLSYPQVPGDSSHKVSFWNTSIYSNNDNTWHIIKPDGRMYVSPVISTFAGYVITPEDELVSPEKCKFKIFDSRWSSEQ